MAPKLKYCKNKKWLNNKYIEVAKKIMKNEFWMLLCREKNDYTEWRKTLFEDMTDEEFHNAAVDYGKTHHFNYKKVQVPK